MHGDQLAPVNLSSYLPKFDWQNVRSISSAAPAFPGETVPSKQRAERLPVPAKPPMTDAYVELHAKSFYSFGAGASHTHELLAQAREFGYPALALTDTNLCGALEFARLANSLGVRPITGGELTLTDGTRLTLLAGTRRGYSNISRLHDHRQCRGQEGAEAGPRPPAPSPRGHSPADGRKRRAAIPAGGGRPHRPGTRSPRAVHGLVRTRLGLRRAPAEPSSVETRHETDNWPGSRRRSAYPSSPPTMSTTTSRSATGCSTPSPPQGSTPRSTRPCPFSCPTITSTSRPRPR